MVYLCVPFYQIGTSGEMCCVLRCPAELTDVPVGDWPEN